MSVEEWNSSVKVRRTFEHQELKTSSREAQACGVCGLCGVCARGGSNVWQISVVRVWSMKSENVGSNPASIAFSNWILGALQNIPVLQFSHL